MLDFQNASRARYIGRHGVKEIFAGKLEQEFQMLYNNPQGGYMNAILIDATLQYLPHDKVIAFNSFYLSWCITGTCVVELEMIKSSSGKYSVAQVVLKQLENPTVMAEMDTYNPSLYTSKLQMIITTSKRKDGFTTVPFNNMPSPPIFNTMKPSRVGLLGGPKLLKVYENLEHSCTGEVWHAFEWTNGSSIDAKSIACFADITALPKPFITRLQNIVFGSQRFEIDFFPFQDKPIHRILIKDMVGNILNGRMTIDMWIYNQDGYLLATARHNVVVSLNVKRAESRL